MNKHTMIIVLQFFEHLSFIFILNIIFSFFIVFLMKGRLQSILSNRKNKDYFKDDSLFEDLDKSLTIFKMMIILSSIFIFIFSLFRVFSWIESALPSLLNFFLYFVVLCVCSFTHLFVYRYGLNSQIIKLRNLIKEVKLDAEPDIDEDDIIYSIESNNIQLETFLNYFLSISIFYTSLHPIDGQGVIVIPILIAQSVFIIKFSENYLVRVFSE